MLIGIGSGAEALNQGRLWQARGLLRRLISNLAIPNHDVDAYGRHTVDDDKEEYRTGCNEGRIRGKLLHVQHACIVTGAASIC